MKDKNSLAHTQWRCKYHLFVKKMQSKSFGQTILTKIVETAKELKKSPIWLALWEENKGAISFYEKNQFRRIDTIELLFGKDIQTGIVMKKIL